MDYIESLIERGRIRRMVREGKIAKEDIHTESLSPEKILFMAGVKEKDFEEWHLTFPVVEQGESPP